jgi:hypothetical protein
MIAYLINPAASSITQIELSSYRLIGRIVGGYIESAARWDTGDCIYVDEEGFLKPQEHYFRLADRPDQPFAGVGVMVGPEREEGDTCYPPVMTLDQLKSRVTFLSRAAAVELLRGRPNTVITDLNTGESKVIATWDDVLMQSKPPSSKV